MKTLVMRTQGTKTVSDHLKGHVFEVSLSDLQNDKVAFRQSRLVTEIIQGKNCLTNFHGMDLFDVCLVTKLPRLDRHSNDSLWPLRDSSGKGAFKLNESLV